MKSRLIFDVELRPVRGELFTPGTPASGPVKYVSRQGKNCVQVGSVQDVVNRLEAVCWDEEADDLVEELRGLSYVRVDGKSETSSLHEPNRLGAAAITSSSIGKELKAEFGSLKNSKRKSFKEAYDLILKYDVMSLLHGAFLLASNFGRNFQVSRVITPVFEAMGANSVMDCGYKLESNEKGEGKGNVPHDTERFSAEKIKLSFVIDLQQIKARSADEDVRKLLEAIAIYKVLAFLNSDLHLRAGCHLEVVNMDVSSGNDFTLPTLEELKRSLPSLIKKVADAGHFGDTPVTVATSK